MTTTGLTIPFTGLKKQYNNLRTEILDATDTVLRSGSLMNGNYTYEFEDCPELTDLEIEYVIDLLVDSL